MTRTGDYEAGGVEVRYDEPEKVHIDELVATAAYVHLERMDTNSWCLIVETGTEKVCLFLGATRASVEACESWRETVIDPSSVSSKGK